MGTSQPYLAQAARTYGPEIIDTLVILSDAQGQRRATGFIVTVPFEELIDGRMYLHAYLVTAKHCTTTKMGERWPLIAECSWMGEQGMMRLELDSESWDSMPIDELGPKEDWVDLAVRPLTGGLYSGAVIGRAVRAVELKNLLDIRRESYGEYAPIGLETVTVGLLQFVPGSNQEVEPMAHFGRLAMVPLSPVAGSWGRMEAYLVENSASAGMSGAPVFTSVQPNQYKLLGVHVGHFNEALGPVSVAQKSIWHSRIGLVAPASKIRDILERETARARRKDIENTARAAPWRFLDRRHRERNAVCWPERFFEDMGEYWERTIKTREYLILRPKNFDLEWDGNKDLSIFGDPWNEVAIDPLGSIEDVIRSLSAIDEAVVWQDDQEGNVRRIPLQGGGSLVFYLDDSGACEAIELIVDFGSPRSDLALQIAHLVGGISVDRRNDEVL